MSCCDGQEVTTKPQTQNQIDKLMLGLPQVVIASSDPRHPLASSIRNSMPPGVTLTIHDDGSIEYAQAAGEPPPEINGFRRDAGNPWLFHPVWLECQARMAGVRKSSGGTIDVKMVCNNKEVPSHFMKFVKPADCSACSLRKNPAQPEG